jgi:arginyl-tRNA synthetase
MQEKIRDMIKSALSKLGFPEADFSVEQPGDLSHGDYASNVALVVGKQSGKKPQEVAQEIVKALEHVQGNLSFIKTEIAGPGFINFHLSPEFFAETVGEILKKKDDFGKNDARAGKTVMVEYTQPNPFKPFHIGHLMSNTIGETLTRMLENAGATVIRANYQGDIGPHVAKALWGIQKKNIDPTDINAVGDAYAFGHEAYETDENAKREIDDINARVYEKSPDIMPLYTAGRDASLAWFEKIYAQLGTKFDEYFFESEVWERGKALVAEGLAKGIFKESEGAVVFPGEEYGLHTRVFITSRGTPTYEAKELGLALLKLERQKFNLSITITAVEQEQYFNVALKALELLRPELAGVFTHVHHGMLVLPSGKMSSRKGNVVTGESLLADMVARAKEKVSARGGASADEIAQDVAVGAVKYFVLKQNIGKNIVFDAEQSLSFEGDSGPYLQYTLTRAQSVLEKARAEGIAPDVHAPHAPSSLPRMLVHFPEILLRAQDEYAPQHITQYLLLLSSAFNSWYAQEHIVDAADQKSPYKIALTSSVATTLNKGLYLLGIPVPERM